ncbi:MAG: hypothetical protein JKY33_10790 [Bacteroidia bacterium]|nr:hypothetical protein [Bacteroidia bacterium]
MVTCTKTEKEVTIVLELSLSEAMFIRKRLQNGVEELENIETLRTNIWQALQATIRE